MKDKETQSSEERFSLDARVVDVINSRALHAELSNGHRFVAFRVPRRDAPPPPGIRPGDRVRVEFSPCDMSKARIVDGLRMEGGS